MAGRRCAAGAAGALRGRRPGAADCVREFRELADGAGSGAAPGIDDPGGAGRRTRPPDPENADGERAVVGPGRRSRVAASAMGYAHAAGAEAGEAGAAERDSHGYTGAAVR